MSLPKCWWDEVEKDLLWLDLPSQESDILKLSKRKLTKKETRLKACMIDITTNFKGKYQSSKCRICKKSDETIEHIMKFHNKQPIKIKVEEDCYKKLLIAYQCFEKFNKKISEK